MKKNPYPGKPSTKVELGTGLVPHLSRIEKNRPSSKWFISVNNKPILLRKKGAGFIVFEGLDGSGQSTQADLLRKFLIKKGHKVVLTKEPTQDLNAGKKIRKILDEKEKISPEKLQKIFTEDRKEHLEKTIIPALKKGKIVISDRYFFSTFAYGVSDGLNLNWLIKLNDKFLLPDLTFILRVRPGVCIRRIEKRGTKKTLFEKEKKLARVWQTYKTLLKKFENVRLVDGENSIKEVFSRIKKTVLLKFSNNK